MSDESRKAFEGRWKELHPHPSFHREVVMENAYLGWQARDAEFAAANARIAELGEERDMLLLSNQDLRHSLVLAEQRLAAIDAAEAKWD